MRYFIRFGLEALVVMLSTLNPENKVQLLAGPLAVRTARNLSGFGIVV